jgi:hypothetical protein
MQQRFAEIEQAQRVNAFDVDIGQTVREVINGDALHFGPARRIGAADAAQLATVHDVEMNGVKVFRGWTVHCS